MKKMKKILTLLLAVCFMLPCFSTVSYAADGVIFFDDLETSVGATFTIKGTVVARNDVLGNATVRMTYDTSYLKFISGDGVTMDSEGTLTYNGAGNGSNDRVVFDITFQALQEGSTRMEQNAATVTTKDGKTVQCENGYSDISIGAGDPSLITGEGEGNGAVEVDGMSYTISNTFSGNVLPQGFAVGEITYKDTVYTGIVHEATGVQGLYLKDAQNIGAFYLYNPTGDAFYPCEEIMISDEFSLVVLAETDGVTLGDEYIEASISINGKEFPAWYNSDKEGYYVIYAISGATGEKSLYLYDSAEHTYQRMEMPEEEKEEVVEDKKDFMTKVMNFVEEHFTWVIAGVVCTFVVLVILLITLAVKLFHRNAELDDLYDEYQIDVDIEKPMKTSKKASNKVSKKAVIEEDEDDEDEYLPYDDAYEEDDYEDIEYEAEDNSDELDDLRRDFLDEFEAERKNYDAYYDDDDFDDDFDDDYDDDSDIRDSVNTDTFEMDFIDFD